MFALTIEPRRGGGWVIKRGRLIAAGPFDTFKEASKAFARRQASLAYEELPKLEGRAKWPSVEDLPISPRQTEPGKSGKSLDVLLKDRPKVTTQRPKQRPMQVHYARPNPDVPADKRKLRELLARAVANTAGARPA